MFSRQSVLLVVLMVGYMQLSYAVTEDDIWLPKKYTGAKYKLLSTAVEAERTERCQQVIQGTISVEKSTAAEYYFVITCRDSNRRSYNLSYRYPLNAAMPILVNEQKVDVAEADEIEEQESDGAPAISSNKAWGLCLKALKVKTQFMLGVVIQAQNPNPSDEGLAEQNLIIPFDTKNPDDIDLYYQANCQVDADKNLALTITKRESSKATGAKNTIMEE